MEELNFTGVKTDKPRELTPAEIAEEEALKDVRRTVVAQEIILVEKTASEREEILDSVRAKLAEFEPVKIDPEWVHHEGLIEEIERLIANDWLTCDLRRKIMFNEEDEDIGFSF